VKAVLKYWFSLSAALATLIGAAGIATAQSSPGAKSPTIVSLGSPAQTLTLTGASGTNLRESGCAGLVGAIPNLPY
jgi:hypothetical protein